MHRGRSTLAVILLGVGILMVAVGIGFAQSANQIKFASRVATIDLAALQLTFTDVGYVATAADDCEIVRVESGLVTPVLFSDIQVGDSVRVCGILQADNAVLAYKIRIFGCK